MEKPFLLYLAAMWLLTPGLRRMIMFSRCRHAMRLLYSALIGCIAISAEPTDHAINNKYLKEAGGNKS